MKTVSTIRAYNGTQGVYSHASDATGTDMTFSVFIPEGDGPFPILWYLSGLTCSHANVTEKGEFRRACAEHGIIFIAPDTSPRGDTVPDDPDGGWDFGLGAGFYVNATEAPFDRHYKMRDYIETELPALIKAHFPQADMNRQGITGHSMGGHGALTIALRNPDTYASVSAFAPICAPLECPWGEKALGGYLGQDRATWLPYDACALIEDGARVTDVLVDQGLEDSFLENQLKPERLEAACEKAGISLTLNRRAGYDHSYYFISSFMSDHIAWHAARLR